MPRKELVYCTVCGELGQDLGGGWWIKLCHKHHQEEITNSKQKEPDEDFYADYDFPCGY